METVAAFTDLKDSKGPLQCPVIGVQGRLVQLKVPKWVEIGSPVKVEADDTISLGEISCCRADGDGYAVWVELLESLHNVAELSRLAHALVA